MKRMKRVGEKHTSQTACWQTWEQSHFQKNPYDYAEDEEVSWSTYQNESNRTSYHHNNND